MFVVDYAQNVALPHTSDTPSSWSFLSLWSVSLFGVYSVKDDTHYHYLYTEKKGGKGPNEFMSMIRHTKDMFSIFDHAFESSS